MINTIQKFNVISDDILHQLINEYVSKESYDTTTMNKAKPGNAVSIILKLLETALEKKLEYVTGNFYKHTEPYLPHTDFKSFERNYLNVVIPLQYTGDQASLIVFDQMWKQDSVTWCMQHPVKYFSYNIGVKGCPYEYPINGLTGQSIDTEFYKTYLSHYPEYCLFGLSGAAYRFEIGSIIAFDNRQIHCTSTMKGEKMGLSLRFKQ
jgi:hypothetical protein